MNKRTPMLFIVVSEMKLVVPIWPGLGGWTGMVQCNVVDPARLQQETGLL